MLALTLLRWLPRAMRHALIRRHATVREADLEGIEVRVATTVEHTVSAARLVHDGYVARGIASAHGSGVRVTPFLTLPTTVIFCAFRQERMVGTLSLVVDSSLGLPLQRIYGDEVDAVRREGRRVAEVGSLCVAKSDRGLGVPYLLNKAMFLCASKLLGVDDLLIAVHPDAADLYRAALCFETIGGVKAYPGLNRRAQAVAMRLRLREGASLSRQAFGDRPSLSNPYHLYFERVDPQIQLPASQSALRAITGMRPAAALKLAALRPDMVTELSERDFQNLRSELRLRNG